MEGNTDIEKKTLLGDILESRRYSKDKKRDQWALEHSTASHYSFTFAGLLSNADNSRLPPRVLLEDWVEKRKKAQGAVRILDLMSYGQALRDLRVEGCAVALSDKRTYQNKLQDASEKRIFIDGDILSNKTWSRIHEYLRQQGEGIKFDLILCHPIGGFARLPHNINLYSHFLHQMYRLLSADNGLLLTQLPENTKQRAKLLVDKLNAINGLSAKSQSYEFAFHKYPEAPLELPDFSDVG